MSKMNYAINVPDTKFDETGHYKTNLIVNAKEGQAIVKSINEEVKKAVTIGAEKANGKEVKKANLPFEEEYVEGKPTGNLIFKFKTKAKIITKDGKVIPNKVAIFDSQGKPMTDISIWSGSEMKVSAELIPYFTAMAGAGVSLRLRAVQITKLVEGGNANSAGHGFDKVEDGYVAPEVDKTFENEVQTNTDF